MKDHGQAVVPTATLFWIGRVHHHGIGFWTHIFTFTHCPTPYRAEWLDQPRSTTALDRPGGCCWRCRSTVWSRTRRRSPGTRHGVTASRLSRSQRLLGVIGVPPVVPIREGALARSPRRRTDVLTTRDVRVILVPMVSHLCPPPSRLH